jgi:cyanoexosortase A
MKLLLKNDKFWIFSSLIGLSILYLNLTWKTTGDLDRITTDSLFWGAILWLLWRRRDGLNLNNDLFSNCLGLLLIVLVLFKSISLFAFESTLIPLIPFFAALGLALLASGFRGLRQYWRELFFAWFLFFPTGVIGYFLDRIFYITVLNAKFATYVLYYFGFNVASQGNEVLLSLPHMGNFKAVVDYPCAGVPMILLMFKLSLLLVTFFSLQKAQRIWLPGVALGIGFFLGVIRVCILTLAIPNPARFDYWHGSNGSQIFSTLAIIIFSFFCHSVLKQQNRQKLVRRDAARKLPEYGPYGNGETLRIENRNSELKS